MYVYICTYVYSHALNCALFPSHNLRAAFVVLVLVQCCLRVSMPLKRKLRAHSAAQECQCLSSPRLSANSSASYGRYMQRAGFPQNQQTLICTTQRAMASSRAMYAMATPSATSCGNIHMQLYAVARMYMANHMRCHGPSGGAYQHATTDTVHAAQFNSCHVPSPYHAFPKFTSSSSLPVLISSRAS